jgi:regulatory protein
VCDSDYIVTAIRPSKRVSGRYSVYINRKFAASLTDEELGKFRLQKGGVLSPSEFEQFSEQFEDRRLREAAYRLLSYRSRSEEELADRLRRRGFTASKVESLISEFRDKNLVSDLRFAEDWVENRLRFKPRGSRLLVMELLAKGVAKETAEQVVKGKFVGVNEMELAFQLLQSRRQRFARENSVDRRRKIYNFLRYRGFSHDVVMRAAGKFLEDFVADPAD